MFNDENDFYHARRRPSLFSYLAVALIGAIIGGIITSYFSPLIGRNQLPDSESRQSSPPVAAGTDSPVIEIAEKVGPTVVGISNRINVDASFFHQNVEKGSGSGVIYSADGYIVTNNHVIQGTESIIVTLPDGKKIPGKIVGADERTDLAVIKIDEKGLKAANFGDSDKIRVGELAVAIGNPLGEQFASTVTAGVISALNRTVDIEEQRFRLLQTDAAISPGNSGGALVNARGQVIGINSVKIVDVDVEGLNFAIPANTVKPIVDSIIKNGRVIRPWLGILGGDVSPSVVQQYKLSTNKGVFISEVPANSPAAKAGIKKGDVIVSFGGQTLKDFGDLRSRIDKHKIGDKIEIVAIRGKEEKKFTVTLEQMPKQ
ncbi:MAG TPA: trypsin-like peptidase domain-containing protein [Desulfobacteria bacterium]|nr:trypsin-like peptidase domain-containing protein [Desulfobacteria bacterium]